jgi:hypothetical protein
MAQIMLRVMAASGCNQATRSRRERDMETTQPKIMEYEGSVHHAARPMKVVADNMGTRWLCDKEVDERKDLRKQGCWQCGELAFTRDD